MTDSAELAIRLHRAAFNRALKSADLSAIGPLLAPHAVLVTGTDSALLSGRKAQLMAWKREFAAAEPTVYLRTTDTVLVSLVEPIGMEHGHWQALNSRSEQELSSGSYAAKWRRIGAVWVIEAEIYITLA